jgi:hypothetical protein
LCRNLCELLESKSDKSINIYIYICYISYHILNIVCVCVLSQTMAIYFAILEHFPSLLAATTSISLWRREEEEEGGGSREEGGGRREEGGGRREEEEEEEEEEEQEGGGGTFGVQKGTRFLGN